jgi:zinc and cadmium transporter
MSSGWLVFVAALAASVGVVSATALLVLLGERRITNLVPGLVSLAVGTLLSAAFLGLLPGALAGAPATQVMNAVLLSILAFFLLEKLLIWRHCHQENCEQHNASGTLILIGDAFHNLVDGVVIASAFLQSPALGVSTTLAVIAHEVPQELGDFGVLLTSGFSRGKAYAYNCLSASTTLAGAGLGYFAVSHVQQAVPYVLAVSAASFLYIGIADLIPVLHRQTSLRAGMDQLLLVLAGVALIAGLSRIGH